MSVTFSFRCVIVMDMDNTFLFWLHSWSAFFIYLNFLMR